MPRSRPASSPLSFHKHTGQYYVTRGGKRIYLGADPDEALEKYYRQAIGQPVAETPAPGLETGTELVLGARNGDAAECH